LRKSFARSAQLVFLYETAPVSAVTGAFSVQRATKAATVRAIPLAAKLGIDPTRARQYYGDKARGWVIGVGLRVPFAKSLPLARLRAIDHYFAVPQSFMYLPRYAPITELLIASFRDSVTSRMKLRSAGPAARAAFAALIKADVRRSYDDIDSDFISQLFDDDMASGAAFSTRKKHILEASFDKSSLGFTVITEKTYGAWKTGPTVVVPGLRGLGLGQEMRRAMHEFCKRRHATRVYCTCPAAKQDVVAYLVRSGMQIEARLERHLARDRDELVFAHQLRSTSAPRLSGRDPRAFGKIEVSRVGADDEQCEQAVRFFVHHLEEWYFRPQKGLADAIKTSMRSLEAGDKRYSAKGRRLYVGRSRDGVIAAVGLVTRKRSDMLKLNYVGLSDDYEVHQRMLKTIVRQERSCRRFYITTPLRMANMVLALNACRFALEGVLRDPFAAGHNHGTFGYLRRDRHAAGKVIGG
jgi:predicted transcriptional regulator/GNAT superfamily N-acetyltransferase